MNDRAAAAGLLEDQAGVHLTAKGRKPGSGGSQAGPCPDSAAFPGST